MSKTGVKFRQHFAYDVEEASNECAIVCKDKSLTIQSMAEDADINVLMDRFGVTGRMPENPRIPMYGDFTGIKDFQSALEALSLAQDAFMELPAKIRARFGNNPQNLLEFIADDANIEEAQRLGLLKEKVDVPVGTRLEDVSRASGSPATAGGAKPGDITVQPAGAGGSQKAPGE